jgi:hypothetical protein
VPSLEEKKLGVYFALNRRLYEIEGYEIKNRNRPNFKMKKKLTLEPTPLIERLKLELSPIFEKKKKKKEPEPNWDHHLENDAN